MNDIKQPAKDPVTATPPVASRGEWLAARLDLLEKEKALTRARDALAAERRRLPMVRLEKPYAFDAPDGKKTLLELFEGRRQLIVYHFMFDPAWTKGCTGCTGFVDALGPADMKVLEARSTSFALVSRAPLEKLLGYRAERGWSWRWVSSFGSAFNYDFHATLDETVTPYAYNYRDKATLQRLGHPVGGGEAHALSVFFQDGGTVFHSYSSFARGCEGLTDAYGLLDLTPYGRQEDWEDSPAGWPQRPTYG